MKFDIQPFVGGKLKDQVYAARMIMKEEQDKKLGIASLTKKQKTEDSKMDGKCCFHGIYMQPTVHNSNRVSSSLFLNSDSFPFSSSSTCHIVASLYL